MSFVPPRQADGRDADIVSLMSGLECLDKSLAQQQFKEECDINTIARRFKLTGSMPDNLVPPQYGDFEGVFDLRTALDLVNAAREDFMRMPADVRSRFGNDPAAFHDFCVAQGDDGQLLNLSEMRRMGLAVPEAVVEAPKPIPVEVVSPPPAKPA